MPKSFDQGHPVKDTLPCEGLSPFGTNRLTSQVPLWHPETQLFSEPGKKGTLFWEDLFSGAATKEKGKKGATEQVRNPKANLLEA